MQEEYPITECGRDGCTRDATRGKLYCPEHMDMTDRPRNIDSPRLIYQRIPQQCPNCGNDLSDPPLYYLCGRCAEEAGLAEERQTVIELKEAEAELQRLREWVHAEQEARRDRDQETPTQSNRSYNANNVTPAMNRIRTPSESVLRRYNERVAEDNYSGTSYDSNGRPYTYTNSPLRTPGRYNTAYRYLGNDDGVSLATTPSTHRTPNGRLRLPHTEMSPRTVVPNRALVTPRTTATPAHRRYDPLRRVTGKRGRNNHRDGPPPSYEESINSNSAAQSPWSRRSEAPFFSPAPDTPRVDVLLYRRQRAASTRTGARASTVAPRRNLLGGYRPISRPLVSAGASVDATSTTTRPISSIPERGEDGNSSTGSPDSQPPQKKGRSSDSVPNAVGTSTTSNHNSDSGSGSGNNKDNTSRDNSNSSSTSTSKMSLSFICD
ncbi:hypothetical protein F5Y11DRAFT_347384 [Daldinia sp. FL1419]|nr:hypothetical protein F5Y11DRAFT_347384 [Daldinia sp. FL1419]